MCFSFLAQGITAMGRLQEKASVFAVLGSNDSQLVNVSGVNLELF